MPTTTKPIANRNTESSTSTSTSTSTATKHSPRIIDRLNAAFNAEIETLTNYIACAANLDGVRAQTIKQALLADVPTELGHAQLLARRIRTLGGAVPGSQSLRWEQDYLQPPRDATDVVAVIKGVIQAEDHAISLYQQIIDLSEGEDYVTQELAIKILSDEQEHRREFAGFLAEYEKTR